MLLDGVVKSVLSEIESLGTVDSLGLAGVAKAIERFFAERVKIVFRPTTDEMLGSMAPAVLLTQELEAVRRGCPAPLHLAEHFVFYATDSDDPLKTRFAVAHELGHILLHKPLSEERADARRYVRMPGASGRNGGLFALQAEPQDEVEADLFAAILCDQLPTPPSVVVLEPPCLRRLAKYIEMGLVRSDLQQLLPANLSCSSCASLGSLDEAGADVLRHARDPLLHRRSRPARAR